MYQYQVGARDFKTTLMLAKISGRFARISASALKTVELSLSLSFYTLSVGDLSLAGSRNRIRVFSGGQDSGHHVLTTIPLFTVYAQNLNPPIRNQSSVFYKLNSTNETLV